MLEKIIVAGLFVGAVFYLYKQFKASFSAQGSACAKNCGGACGVDMTAKMQELEAKNSI